jgi:ribosomal protein L37AE/L43A
MRETFDCPVCANVAGQLSKDGGETWQCDFCMGVHSGTEGDR